MISKTLAILAFSLMAAPIFCGNKPSTPATRKKIKLADKTTLDALFKETEVCVYIQGKILTDFPEKVLSENGIEGEVDAIFKAFWTDKRKLIAKKEGDEYDRRYTKFVNERDKIKPTILGILVKSSVQIDDQTEEGFIIVNT